MSSSPSGLPDHARTLGSLLRAPYRRLQRRLYAQLALRHPAVRRAHSVVFRHLRPEGSRLSDLAASADMTKQSMSYLVNHLVAEGYLRHRPAQDDARAVCLTLSPRGERFVAELIAAGRDSEAELARLLGCGQMEELRRLLIALNQAVEHLPAFEAR